MAAGGWAGRTNLGKCPTTSAGGQKQRWRVAWALAAPELLLPWGPHGTHPPRALTARSGRDCGGLFCTQGSGPRAGHARLLWWTTPGFDVGLSVRGIRRKMAAPDLSFVSAPLCVGTPGDGSGRNIGFSIPQVNGCRMSSNAGSERKSRNAALLTRRFKSASCATTSLVKAAGTGVPAAKRRRAADRATHVSQASSSHYTGDVFESVCRALENQAPGPLRLIVMRCRR